MVEAQAPMERLLVDDERKEEGPGGSLQEMTERALSNPRVREMLDAFREGGPGSLAQFVNNPEYHASLDAVRGRRRELDLPELPVATPSAILPGPRKKHFILGVTGSVAAIKVYELALALVALGAQVKVVPSSRGYWFMQRGRTSGYDTQSVEAFDKALTQGSISIIRDEDEWQSWQQIGDDVLHISLRDWADAIIIAPLSANSLAHIATGACPDLLTCILRAWDFSHASSSQQQTDLLGLINNTNKKPIILAPAMNTAMWAHPFTSAQLDVCRHTLGAVIVNPVSKTLACGDTGIGALAPVSSIVHATRTALAS